MHAQLTKNEIPSKQQFHPSNNIFQKYKQAIHPNEMCNEMPPEHTLIIKGNITSSIRSTKWKQIDRHLRNCIITSCGDANIMIGSKYIDPALCVYI